MSFIHLATTGEAQPFPAARADARAVMIPGAEASTACLAALAASGFRLILIVQDLSAVSAARPVDGALILQVTPRTAAWLLGVSRAQFGAIWQQPDVSLRSLARRLRVAVDTSTFPTAPATNVAGYSAGRHPTLSKQLVIVAANLDTHAPIAGERVTDYRMYGTGLSALLEVARNEVAVSRRWTHPMRTVMFVALNSRDGSGLANMLETPPWEAERIHTLIYIGLREEDEAAVRALVERHGIRLDAIPPPVEPLFERRFVFASARSARSRSPIPQADPAPRSPDTSTLMSRAVQASIDLAGEAHRLIQQRAGVLPPSAPDVVVQAHP